MSGRGDKMAEPEMIEIKIGDCADVKQGKNLDKKYINTEKKGLPYIVGASCLKDFGLVCDKYTAFPEKSEVSHFGDIIVSTVGTLGKMAVNNIGDCVLSKHVCAVKFVPQIIPEYGLLCLMASMKNCIPPEDEMQTGFSRRLDISDIMNLPFTLVTVNYQHLTVSRMMFLGLQFYQMSKGKETKAHTADDLPDDPVELINQFKKETNRKLREMYKALGNIVDIIREDWKTEDSQMNLFMEEV